MKEETQQEILALAKTALTFLSADCDDRDFVFKFRDAIKKAEQEMRGCDASNEIH